MITLSDFQAYLSAEIPLPQSESESSNYDEQQLLKWAVALSAQTETQQLAQLEKILTEMVVSDIQDALRLKLMGIVATATDRLITSLRQHYISELGPLDHEQLRYSAQVKSLYYLTILVYDGVIKRESQALAHQKQGAASGWRPFFSLSKKPPLILATAIYQSLSVYQKLMYEQAISYEYAQRYLWGAINQLYYLAHQSGITHVNLSRRVVISQVMSVHEAYVQLCLISLLNTRAMRRANVILLQRLLPTWSSQVNATIEPLTDTRVFVNLQGSSAPVYLTASSSINPYEDDHHCLFIELRALASYLQQRHHELLQAGYESIEAQLVSKVLMAIKHRYLERQFTVPARLSPKQRAIIITGFNAIHYHVADGQGLMSMIAANKLPSEQLPRYDTQPKQDSLNANPNTDAAKLYVETFDSTDVTSTVRVLQLLSVPDIMQRQAIVDERMAARQRQVNATHQRQLNIDGALSSMASIETDEGISNRIEAVQDSLSPLSLMSLFLLCRPSSAGKLKWSLGMVRWLSLESKLVEVEWQALGHELTACALRLDNRNPTSQRSQRFAPALLIKGDKDLQTEPSIAVPPYQFQTGDRVIMRIHDSQEVLRLQECLINSEGFGQYKFVRL